MNKDKELMLIQRELDRAYDRLIDVEYENKDLRARIDALAAQLNYGDTIESWDRDWIEELEEIKNMGGVQLSLPLDGAGPSH